jgi:hypothetical protein
MDNNEFFTTDLYLAAYIQTARINMIRSDKDERGRVLFVFDSSDHTNFEFVRNNWFDHSASVPAQEYANNIRSLKALCFSKNR